MNLPLTPTQAANAARVLASWATGLDLDIAPVQIDFEPTNRCNLRCGFCPNRFRGRPRGFLDLDLFRRVVDETAATTIEYHLDMMGEPLLHPDLSEMVRHATLLGARVVLYTNLSTGDELAIRALARSLLDRVVVNLSTLDPATYRDRYGRDALARVLRNLALLREARGGATRPRVVVSWLDLGERPPGDLVADEVWVQRPHDWLGTPGLLTAGPRPHPRPPDLTGIFSER